MRLVLVHGRDQQGKSSESLKEVWKAALDVGLSQAGLTSVDTHEIHLPYYGDALESSVQKIRASSISGLMTKGATPAQTHIEAFQVELLQELLSDQNQTSSEPGAPIQKGLQNTTVAHLLAKLADNSPWNKELLAVATGDVAAYLNSVTIEKEINAIVESAIPREVPCVVVGHSLGSIVAYRVLQKLGKSTDVVRFITLGSPLGLKAIRNVLRPLSVPAGVRSWLNVYDTRDIVALRPLDESTWNVLPAIKNIALDNNHMANRHGISGYLDYVDVATAVFEALNSVSGERN